MNALFKSALVSVFLLTACPGGSRAQEVTAKKVALVVGINKYNHADFPPLEFAENDVKELARVLTDEGYAVTSLVGKEATLAAIRGRLDKLCLQSGDGGVFLVALAGHGIQPGGDKDAYFCPYDAGQRVILKNDPDPKNPWNYATMLPVTDVFAYMKASPASSRLLLVDACRSDPAAARGFAVRGRGFGTNLQVGSLPNNTAVLLSCSSGQSSLESKEWGSGHGAFFHCVLEGMRGKGLDKSGRVTADSLWEYVQDAVPASLKKLGLDGDEQRPFRMITGNVDLKMTVSRKPDDPSGDSARKLPSPGEVRKFEIAPGVFMEFCWVPPGEAQLGSPQAERDVVLELIRENTEPVWLAAEAETRRPKFKTQGFWLGKYTVTQEEWQAVMGENPSYFDGKKDNKAKGLDTNRFPVETVSWDDCQKFLERINRRNGIEKVFGKGVSFKLPHEDQWEYACRGGRGNTRAFYFGNVLNGTQANCNGNYSYGTDTKGQYLERTCAVDFTNGGKYEKHPWGLCHMSGNVYQWCSNMYDSKNYVLRGGSWGSSAWGCRSAYRFSYVPDYRIDGFGFRVCLPLER